MTGELKNCPFCGSNGMVYGDKSHGFYASCTECECAIGYDNHPAHGYSFTNRAEAIYAWNERVEDE